MALYQKQFSESNSAGASVMHSRYPSFSCSGGIQGLVLEKSGRVDELLILRALLSEWCYFSVGL